MLENISSFLETIWDFIHEIIYSQYIHLVWWMELNLSIGRKRMNSIRKKTLITMHEISVYVFLLKKPVAKNRPNKCR